VAKDGFKSGADLALQAEARAWRDRVEAEPEAALAALLEKAISDAPAAAAWLDSLAARPSEAGLALAGRLAESAQIKPLRKAAKKVLYRLRQKGLQAPPPERGPALFQPAQPAKAFGHLSAYQEDGQELILLAFPRSGGQTLAGAVINHFLKGLGEANLVRMKHRQFQELLDEAGAEGQAPVRIEEPDLVWLLRRGLQRTRRQGRPLSEELSFLAAWLNEKPPDPEPPALYRRLGLVPGLDPEPAALRRLAELLDQPPCQRWRPDLELWAEVGPELAREADSGLVLTPGQETQRLAGLLAKTRDKLFPAESRSAWRDRLEETALWLESAGRPEEAVVFLAAAGGIERADNPLFQVLSERAWRAGLAEAAQEDPAQTEGSSLIQPPGPGQGLILPGRLKESP